MIKRKKALTVIVAAALLLAVALTGANAASSSPSSVVSAKHYNVMLVIDGSGSLTMSGGTDRNGYRYDAVQLFLGLMTNSGNYAGAIVFDDKNPMPLNTELRPISGSVAKKELAQQIRNARAGGDTDIGGALLEAVRKLEVIQETNGLPSVVILMSDGVTDLPWAPQGALEQSYANEELAISEAAENNIPVYAVLLNGNGSVSTGEMEHIAAGTGGAYREVRNAGDLSEVYTLFYSLIYNANSVMGDGQNVFTFNEEGVVVIEQEIPGFGVKEINMVANSPTGITSVTVVPPNGEPMEELEDEILRSDYYEFVKIEDPMAGLWRFEIHGDPGNEVKVDLIYNSNLGINLENTTENHSYESGSTASITAHVMDGRSLVTDAAAYDPSYLTVTLTNAMDPSESYPMTVTANGKSFTASAVLPEVDAPTTYVIQAEFNVVGIQVTSNTVVIDVNPVTVPEVNNPPVASTLTLEHEVKDSGDGYDYIDLTSLFTDADGDALTITLASSDYKESEVLVQNGRLVIDSSVRNGSCVVRATDGKASALVTVHLLGNAVPVASADSVTIQIETNKLFDGKKTESIDLTQWFSDEDGDTLTYAIVACDYEYDKNGTVTLDQNAATLNVVKDGFKKSNLVLRATDPKGAYCELTVHFKVLNWWLIYGGIVIAILVIAGAVLITLAIIISRRRFHGYILVENVTAGSFGGSGSGGFKTKYPSQRKKLYINSLYGVSSQGFHKKSVIAPLSPKKIRFQSPKPFLYNGRKVKKVDIGLDSAATVYASENDGATGLLISTQGKDNFSNDNGFDGGGDSLGGNGGFSW